MSRDITFPSETIIKRSKIRSTQSLSEKVVLLVAAVLTTTAGAETCPQINEIHFNMPQKTSILVIKPGMFMTASGWTSDPVSEETWVCEGVNCYQESDYPKYIKKFAGATFSVTKKDGSEFARKLESCNYVASHYPQTDRIVRSVIISMKPPDSRFLTVVIYDEKMWRSATYICDQSIDACKFDLKSPIPASPLRSGTNPFAR